MSEVSDARAWAREANDRAATYRAALLTVREALPQGSDAIGLINRVLAPTAEPRVRLSSHCEQPVLRAHRDARCARRFEDDPRLVAAFISRMVGAVPCPDCSAIEEVNGDD